jgi:transcriptional regulator with GAF, ATPase, and Fis domain
VNWKPPLAWPKHLIILAGAVALAYALTVLCYVAQTPDIPLRCAFSPVISNEVDSSQVFPTGSGAILPGDHLLQVGDSPLSPEEKLSQLPAQLTVLRALTDLQQAKPTHVDDLAAATGMPYVEWQGKELVHVRIQRQTDGQILSAWCPLRRMPLEDLLPSILWFLLKAGLFAVGVFVVWNRPGDRSARQFFLLCLATLVAYMGGYHWARIALQPTLFLIFMTCGVLLPAASLHFYLVFPRAKDFLDRRLRLTLGLIYGVPLAFLVALAAGYLRLRWLRSAHSADGHIAAAWSLLRSTFLSYLPLAALWYLACVICLVHSFRRARDVVERNQVKWILFGAVIALLPLGYSLYLINWKPDVFAAGGITWPMFLASVCFTVAFAVSITRYRLMQLDQILSSGMVYFLLSSVAGLFYYGVVFAGMLVSRVVFGPPSLEGALSVSAALLLLLVLFDLARGRFKKVLDRHFDREKHQLDRTLRRMGQAIEQLVDPPTLARRLLQACTELLNVSHGAVYLRTGDPPLYRLTGCIGPTPALAELSPGCPLVEQVQRHGVLSPRPASSEGADPAQRQLRFLGGEVAQALLQDGRLLALLVLGPRQAGSYSPADLNLLAAFARFTALALESAAGHHTIEALNRDLRDKIEKISEQQRRILALQTQLRQAPPAPTAPAADAKTAAPANGADVAGGSILGTSRAVRDLLELIRKVSVTSSAVLIRGESGTGKGLLARAVHDHSARAGKPYVTVHCAALSSGLLESELFGHVKGAFTGAHRDKVGRFELADGGTLFLDEIGDISLEVQVKLLRVLEEKTFERVGSSEPVQVDVRVVAATHQNLEELIERGRFREDLYHRLKVIDLHVPPLRERGEDIPELALHFLRVYAGRCGKAVAQIDDDAMAVLKAQRWAGNIRQLEHAVERAVVVADGPVVTVRDLPPDLVRAAADGDYSADEPRGGHEGLASAGPGIRAEREERARRERERLVRAMAAAHGNKAEAARALGLARSTFLSRLKKYGLS